MKLAEALSLRKDLQKKIEQLKSRIMTCVKVQEGDEPSEQPDELMKELESCLAQLERLVYRINATNMQTVSDGKTLTQMMAEKETMTKRLQVWRDVFDTATDKQSRYSRSEIKFVTTIDVRELGARIDHAAQQLRHHDIAIQSLNFMTDLIE